MYCVSTQIFCQIYQLISWESLRGFIKEKLNLDIKASQDWTPLLNKNDVIIALDTLSSEFQRLNNNPNGKLIFRRWLNKQLLIYHDHAVLSAVLLLIDFQRWPHLSQLANECALAIALHNHHKIRYEEEKRIKNKELLRDGCPAMDIGILTIEDYPLAYLLVYCDNAQEWGRPSVKYPSDHISFKQVGIRPPDIVYISLEYDVIKFMNMQRQRSIIIDEAEAFEELDENNSKFINLVAQSWKSNGWRFYIRITISKNNPPEPIRIELKDLVACIL